MEINKQKPNKLKILYKEIEDFVTDYPVQFLMGICFIVGFVLCALIL